MITPGLNHPGLGSGGEAAALRETLDELRLDSGARLLMVVDRAGAVVISSGESEGLDEAGFASLSAAHFGANRQLATLVGESDFRGLSHLGNRSSVHLAAVADTAILAVLHDGARSSELLCREGEVMVERLESPMRSMLAPGTPKAGDGPAASDWAVDAEHEIDRIFRETC